MKKVERIQKILELLWRERQLSTTDIRRAFALSPATARRDIHYLAQNNRGISRYHGGVRLDEEDADHEQPFDVKLYIDARAKQAIAGRAARMVRNGDRLFLDSGSTCLFMARELSRKAITVVACDVKIASELGGYSNIESYVVGGLVRPGYYSVGTSLALSCIENFSIDTVFLSCDALDTVAGITNASVFEVDVKRLLLERCEHVVLMADHAKFDRHELHTVAPVSSVDVIVTDAMTPEDTLERYRALGPRIVVA